MWPRILAALRPLFARTRFEREMAEEMRLHLELYAEELVRSGVAPAEAARRARVEFGGLDSVKDDCRKARGLRLADDVYRDLRYAFRLMRKTPGFTAIALATLALCLGANLAIFAVVDSVLLRPLPFPAPDRLVRVFNTYPKAGVPDDGCSVTNYYERRGQIAAFASLGVYREGTAIVGETGATAREPIARVSPEFFATLGLGPTLGRAFTEEETTWKTDGVAVLTDGYWRQHLAGDPRVVGRTIRVDGVDKTVVGVLPPEFGFLSSKARLYLPYASNPEEREPRRRHWGSSSQMIARLLPGATLELAQSQVDAHNAAVAGDSPEAKAMAAAGFRTLVVPLHADHVAAIRPTVVLVQAGALFLLSIGAVNLVNLLLIRAAGRAKELAVRQAIGASRGHIVSAVVVETTSFTLLGGLLGLGVGAALVRLLSALGADRLPLGARLGFDARVALAALIAAVLLGVAIAVPVAWHSLRGASGGALQAEARRSATVGGGRPLRHGFVVAQIALAFVLLAGTGLLSLSLKEAMSVAPGFRPQQVATGYVALPDKSYPNGAAGLAFAERLLEALEREPGVSAAGISSNVPLSGNAQKSAATVEGHTRRPGEAPRGIYSYSVDGDYFTAMGFTLREGRFLTAADSRRPERFCVVDEDFARRYWPSGAALGQRLFEGSGAGQSKEAFTVVGVVGTARQAGLAVDEALGAVYYPYGHRPSERFFVVARTRPVPEARAVRLADVVRRIDPELPLSDVRTMEARVADSLVARRSPALLAGLFSALAVLLTALGTYGVLGYAVAERRREIGLRMALGARPAQVRRQFVALGLRLLAAGTLVGLAGAAIVGRAMQAVLFRVPAFHPATLAATGAVLLAVCLLACLVPSHRASRIAPTEALAEP
jgi:predicted permease